VCVHCGKGTETRDHVPSKVFLDEPFPANLPVVYSCEQCNNKFSKDEDYLASLVECAKIGSIDLKKIERDKIAGVLQHSPALYKKLANLICEVEEVNLFTVETNRIKTMLLKLARGHAAFELHELHLEQPLHVSYALLNTFTDKSRRSFEESPKLTMLPEVGSRALQRIVESPNLLTEWIIVQDKRYRYLTIRGFHTIIRGVIGEYLAFEVIWES
jgi:hypothetical protein